MSQITVTSLPNRTMQTTGSSLNNEGNPFAPRVAVNKFHGVLTVAGLIMVSSITSVPLLKSSDASVSRLINLSSFIALENQIAIEELDWDLQIKKPFAKQTYKLSVKLNYTGRRKPTFEA